MYFFDKEPLWRNASTGAVYQWQMNGLAISGQGSMPTVPANWMIAGIGDVNGDGIADILWRESGGLNYLWIVNGLGITSWSKDAAKSWDLLRFVSTRGVEVFTTGQVSIPTTKSFASSKV